VALSNHSGAPLVVNFWASWCPPCIAEMPDLEAVHQLAGDQVRFLGINTQDTAQRAAELVEETGVTYDLVRDPDGEVSRAFEVFGMPSTFYVAADGTIVGRHTGLLTRDALVDDLAEHRGVEVP
jgi:cytochrome c biogenesis protein CcmG/thiol:disulfide interchange protein DsbE